MGRCAWSSASKMLRTKGGQALTTSTLPVSSAFLGTTEGPLFRRMRSRAVRGACAAVPVKCFGSGRLPGCGEQAEFLCLRAQRHASSHVEERHDMLNPALHSSMTESQLPCHCRIAQSPVEQLQDPVVRLFDLLRYRSQNSPSSSSWSGLPANFMKSSCVATASQATPKPDIRVHYP